MLPDLEGTLKSFQAALKAGELQLQRGTLDPDVYLHLDLPNGEPRLTYVRLDGKTVTALVTFIQCDPVESERCYNVGWAVPKNLRGQGRAAEIFKAAVKELRHGLARHGAAIFYVEGIIDVNNKASQKVAERVISPPVTTSTDSAVGVPIIQYLRRIDSNTEI